MKRRRQEVGEAGELRRLLTARRISGESNAARRMGAFESLSGAFEFSDTLTGTDDPINVLAENDFVRESTF